jgi:hypothetical protein
LRTNRSWRNRFSANSDLFKLYYKSFERKLRN